MSGWNGKLRFSPNNHPIWLEGNSISDPGDTVAPDMVLSLRSGLWVRWFLVPTHAGEIPLIIMGLTAAKLA